MEINIIGESPEDKFNELLDKNQMSLTGREAILASFPNNATYMEWGSGGSTLWLNQQNIQQELGHTIISVEHNVGWYEDVRKALNNYLSPTEKDFLYLLKQSKFDGITVGEQRIPFIATPFEEMPVALSHYIHPEEVDFSTVDVFLVDGLARGACLANIKMFAKTGAKIFLHDIDQREEWYQWATDLWDDTQKSLVYHNMMLIENV